MNDPIESDKPAVAGSSPVPCSAWCFEFSAEHPPESDMFGGTYLQGELECDPENLPEAICRIIKDAFLDWETEGQTHISFSIKPNTQAQATQPAPQNDESKTK